MRAFWQVALLGLVIRVVLLIYGQWQDRCLEVKYTDVDYWVFTDAALALRQGLSPYSRSTFRYTPWLAALLVPNQWNELWGKALFCLADILAGYLIYLFLLRSTNATRAARLMAFFWLLNPITFTISSRGNAESLTSCSILGFLYALTCHRYAIAGLLYGLAIHMKIFPIIYGMAILTFLLSGKSIKQVESPPMSPNLVSNVTPTPSPTSSQELNSSTGQINKRRRNKNTTPIVASKLGTPSKINTIHVTPRKDRFRNFIVFFLFASLSLGILGGMAYYFYGEEYLKEAVLYHLIRRDHRHNFSPYFLLFYLESVLPLPRYFEFIVFIPQLLVFFLAGFKFGRKDLPFACFIITFVFVAFNKVITSQYFVWYLTLFPLAFISMHNISLLRWTIITGLWFAAQGLWLKLAYNLEFLGMNTFSYLWLASLSFIMINTWIAGQFIRHRLVPEILHPGPGIITLNNAIL